MAGCGPGRTPGNEDTRLVAAEARVGAGSRVGAGHNAVPERVRVAHGAGVHSHGGERERGHDEEAGRSVLGLLCHGLGRHGEDATR